MTKHQHLVEVINKRLFTDFIFADKFYLCVPTGVSRAEARRRWKELFDGPCPKIDECWYTPLVIE